MVLEELVMVPLLALVQLVGDQKISTKTIHLPFSFLNLATLQLQQQVLRSAAATTMAIKLAAITMATKFTIMAYSYL